MLAYHALTNLAAVRLAPEHRLAPRWVAWAGLSCCAGLAFFVEREVWLLGLGRIAAALLPRAIARRGG